MKRLLFLLLLIPAIAFADDVTFAWVAPVNNIDGTAATDLATYHLYQSPTSGVYTGAAIDTGSTATTFTLKKVSFGKSFFIVRAVNTAGKESANSNEVNFTVASVPNPPTGFSFLQKVVMWLRDHGYKWLA